MAKQTNPTQPVKDVYKRQVQHLVKEDLLRGFPTEGFAEAAIAPPDVSCSQAA